MDSKRNRSSNFSETELKLLEDYASRLNSEIIELRKQVQEMRIDRQLRSFPSWLFKKIKRALKAHLSERTKNRIKVLYSWSFNHSHKQSISRYSEKNTLGSSNDDKSILILAHNYPTSDNNYGGQHIERRVYFYKAAGYEVSIFVPTKGTRKKLLNANDGTPLYFAPLSQIEKVVKQTNTGQLAIHSPTPDIYESTKQLMLDLPTHIWIHGFEARSWRELISDFSAEEIATQGKRLDMANVERQWTLSELFTNPDINKIFVSEYMRSVAEEFARTPALDSHVIHNVIDPNLFPYIPKSEEMRMRICSIRNFGKRNYATDLMSQTIFILSKMPWFSKLSIEIFGDGKHFEQDTAPLLSFKNVKLQKSFVGAELLKGVFLRNGIGLLPTRWDSQGMLNGEAMSTGVVPISNAVTAIPEFISEREGILADPENAKQLAEGISALIENPTQFLAMSESAQVRVRNQCGPDVTVQREIDLFEKACL